MPESVAFSLKRSLVVVSAAAAAAVLVPPHPAQAQWRGGVWVGIGPAVPYAPPPPVYAPPPVFYPPPPAVYPPPYRPVYPRPARIWVPGHWNRWGWVPGHWAYRR